MWVVVFIFVLRSPMQGPTKKYIMQSKLLVNVQENGSPCITVIQPNIKPGQDFILADKVLQMFFENMDVDAKFCGVLTDNLPDSRVRTIIPMDIPQVLEWLSRFFFENKSKTSSAADEILCIFTRLKDIYYNHPELENVFIIKGSPLSDEAKKGSL